MTENIYSNYTAEMKKRDENYMDFDCDSITFEDISELKDDLVRHTNSPCIEYKDIASFYRTSREKASKPSSKFKYFKVEPNNLPSYQFSTKKTTSGNYEKVHGYSAGIKETRKVHKSPISPCFSAGRERNKKTTALGINECKTNIPCTVNCDNKYKRSVNVTVLSEKLLELSVAKPSQRVSSTLINRGKTKKIREGYFGQQVNHTGGNFSDLSGSKVDLPSLGRPLKKENGKYRPMSMIKLTAPIREPLEVKSSKSADAYLRHLKVSTCREETALNNFAFSRTNCGRFPSLDTRLLEAVSKYNKPLWEDLIGRY